MTDRQTDRETDRHLVTTQSVLHIETKHLTNLRYAVKSSFCAEKTLHTGTNKSLISVQLNLVTKEQVNYKSYANVLSLELTFIQIKS